MDANYTFTCRKMISDGDFGQPADYVEVVVLAKSIGEAMSKCRKLLEDPERYVVISKIEER